MTHERGQVVFDEVGVVGKDRAAEGTALSVDMLGGGIHDDIGAQFQRPLQYWRREHIIDDNPGARLVGQIADRLNVDDFKDRVGRRLQKYALGFGRQRGLPFLQVNAVDEDGFDPEFRKLFGNDVKARPEQRPGRDNPVPGLELAGKGGEHCRHAGRRRNAGLRSLQERQALFEHRHGWVGVARIHVALFFALEGLLGFFGRLVNVAGRQKQSFAGFAKRRALRPAPDKPSALAPICRIRFLATHGGVLRFISDRHEKKAPTAGGQGYHQLGPFSGFFNVGASRSTKSPRNSGK